MKELILLLFVTVGIVITSVAGAVFGALAGWLVSELMPDLVCGGLNALGLSVEPSQLPAIGAALGFIGMFFRSYSGRITNS